MLHDGATRPIEQPPQMHSLGNQELADSAIDHCLCNYMEVIGALATAGELTILTQRFFLLLLIRRADNGLDLGMKVV
jgi:hypothetical protein